MKDSEFIDLLNLYLDHEISAADAARLEAEVQNNPARRRVYQDYCRMQKACKMLAEEFQNEPVSVPDPKVIDFEVARRRARAGNYYVAGAFAAAAACVAIIFVGRSREQAGALNSADVVADAGRPAAVQTVAGTAAATPSVPAPRAIAQTVNVGVRVEQPSMGVVAGQPLLLSGNAQADAVLRAAAEQAAAQFAWMERVQLAPIQQRGANSELRFDARPASMRTDPGGAQRLQQEAELSAYRFQR